MNPTQFKKTAPGRLVEIENTHAFVPNTLPPKIKLSSATLKLLEQATLLVGTLNGTGRSLQNPNLIIQPFVRREAVLSSKIEGTAASFSDLVLYEADPSTSRRDANVVYSYVKALQGALEKSKTLPVAMRLICETHAALMEGVSREKYAYPGSIRKHQVYIGDERLGIKKARFVPPPPDQIMRLITDFENYVNSDQDAPLLVKLAVAHYQFETIHPFMDGNGRMGRLLITLLLCVNEWLSVPLLYLSAYFSTHKKKYYDNLLSVSTDNAWEVWIDFFLKGVIETAQDAIVRSRKLLDLKQTWCDQLVADRCGDTAQMVLALLFEYPAFTIPRIAKSLNSTYPTIQKATDKLVERGFIRLLPESHHPKIYVSSAIIAILEETPLLREDEAA